MVTMTPGGAGLAGLIAAGVGAVLCVPAAFLRCQQFSQRLLGLISAAAGADHMRRGRRDGGARGRELEHRADLNGDVSSQRSAVRDSDVRCRRAQFLVLPPLGDAGVGLAVADVAVQREAVQRSPASPPSTGGLDCSGKIAGDAPVHPRGDGRVL